VLIKPSAAYRNIIDSYMGQVFFEVLKPVVLLYYLLFQISNKLFHIIEKKMQIPRFEFERW